ncbi:MAG TPA: hypothetical protein VFN30_02200 [Chitinophagaceae bacterium]|nr:hypothetical protein [Chitinophagaceae bacterium]
MRYPWRILAPLLAGTIVMIIVLQLQGQKLRTIATPLGILNLEFAKTTEEAEMVITAWQSDTSVDLIATAKWAIWLDFIFIFFYSFFLFGACKRIYHHGHKWQRKAGREFAYGSLIAGVLDVIENILMLQALDGHYGLFSTLLTFICAIIKFTLVGLAVLYILLGIKRLFHHNHSHHHTKAS